MMKSKQSALLLSGLFLITIFLPLLVMLGSEDAEISQAEKRYLAKRPELQLEKLEEFPAKYEAYVNDHFGLREQLVYLYNRLFIAVFGSSPNPGVVVGHDKWLFMAAESVIEDYMGLATPGDNQLLHWKQILADRQEWLESLGVRYLFLAPPNKVSIYPEYLPERIRKRKGDDSLTRFFHVLDKEPRVTCALDLRPALLKAKSQEQLYLKGDTHWNFDGSYVAYVAMIERLQQWFPEMHPVPKEKMRREYKKLAGDLSLYLNMGEYYSEETSLLHVPGAEAIAYQAFPGYPQPDTPMQKFRKGRMHLVETEGHSRTAVFICDSFGAALRNYMTSHFGRLIFVRDARFEDIKRLIEEERPDVVIDLNVARGIHVALGENLEIREWAQERRLGDSTEIFSLAPGDLGRGAADLVELRLSPDGEALDVTGPDPQLHFRMPGGVTSGTVQLRCQIASPTETTLRLFFQTPEHQYYSMEKSLSMKLRRGQNFVSFRIYEPFLLDKLRLDPGEAPGRYRLESFSLIAERPHQG